MEFTYRACRALYGIAQYYGISIFSEMFKFLFEQLQ